MSAARRREDANGRHTLLVTGASSGIDAVIAAVTAPRGTSMDVIQVNPHGANGA
jgi:hypothetical protein